MLVDDSLVVYRNNLGLIHTLHLNLLILKVVTTRLEGKTPPKQPKFQQELRKEISGPVETRKIWFHPFVVFLIEALKLIKKKIFTSPKQMRR
jgi:hypothetical protein